MQVNREKPKIAMYWCSSCGGCEESVIDLAEDILNIVDAADIVFWPIAVDFKVKHIHRLKDQELDITLINGAVRMDEQEEMACLLRKKSKLLIAHGSCAHIGGVVGLANFFSSKDILDSVYCKIPSVKNPHGMQPQTMTMVAGEKLRLPAFYDRVKPLDQVVDVDYYIPGCPPTPELMKKNLMDILEGHLPPKGSVLAEKKALCSTCPRKESIPDKIRIRGFKRIHQVLWDPEKCFLPQGIICMGPATRGGCNARCINANMPCRGCFGPVDNIKDQGAKVLSFLSGLIHFKDEDEFRAIADSIPDPGGLFYRYSLAASILKGKISEQNE